MGFFPDIVKTPDQRSEFLQREKACPNLSPLAIIKKIYIESIICTDHLLLE